MKSDAFVGRLLDGRYRVGQRIARGGMATVYEAIDLRLDRPVAIKVLPHSLSDNEDFSRRFVREAQAAARLAHPGVVAVYDQGDDDGTLFLAMEYVPGRRTLRDLVREEAPLSPVRALAIFEDILAAIGAAHESGIIHRDVKPENVLVDPRGRVKVADFGLARAISATTTAAATGGVLMGTVSYLAPELVTDGRCDARSDVYALGVVLFELLTGRKPHTGDSSLEVAYAHVHEDVPAPSSLIGGIPAALDAYVARATARRRDLRPADAHVMLEQLRTVRSALEHGEPDDTEVTRDVTHTAALPVTEAAVLARPDEVFDVTEYDDFDRTDQPSSTRRARTSGAAQTVGAAAAGRPSLPTRRRRWPGWVAFAVVVLMAVLAALAGWSLGSALYGDGPSVGTLIPSGLEVRPLSLHIPLTLG